MQEDHELNEVVVETLMKALVEEEGLPRDRVERGVQRFLEAIKEQGPKRRIRTDEGRGNGGQSR